MATQVSSRVRLAEQVFGIAALLYGSTAFIRLIMTPDEFSAIGDENLASPTKRLLWISTYLIGMYFLAKQRHRLKPILKQMVILNVLLAYLAISILWSGTRGVSTLSVAALFGNSLLGMYFGIRYKLNQFLWLLGWFCGISTVATLVSPLFTRGYALDTGEWTGFFANKNGLGMIMIVSFIVFTMLARKSTRRKWRYLVLSGLSAGLVILSGSATCAIILCVLVCIMGVRHFVGRRSPSHYVLSLLALCFLLLGLSQLGRVPSALEGSKTFMNRVAVWGVSMSMLRDRMWLGYGYGGFWVFGGPAETVWSTIGLDPEDASYAHNGYVQVLLDGGIVGFSIFLMLLTAVTRRAWWCFKEIGDPWPLYFLSFLVLHNLTETTFLARNSVCWLLFVAVSVQLFRAYPMTVSKRFEDRRVFRSVQRQLITPA